MNLFSKSTPVYINPNKDKLNGWYRMIGEPHHKGNNRNLHYFFEGKTICNTVLELDLDCGVFVDYCKSKCKNCERILNTYRDLRNIPT